ncbi:NADPH:quinone oxidoreductase family protein [Pseudooceanicola sp. C21-150M6]|uniref:NADPH:quinone oxidoreductase family protein n=1 Tax=Pseudooceanicola sp. C21-150M6 TaxID=3434355 RepID=UPI003D7F5CBA
MKAVMCTAFDGPEALRIGTLPDPEPASDEVLVEVQAASVSFMDLLMISGGYQLRPDLPYVPGTDAAGVARAVGADVAHIRPGDRVIGTGWHGAYAERMVVKGWRCNRLPEGVDMVDGSTVAHTYATAHYALKLRAGLQAGEWLLVTGAAGGVGLAAVDMGRMMGARVIACVSRAEKAGIVRDYGAAEVIVLEEDNLRDRVKEITGGRGVDVCFEMLGGETFLTLARVMAWNGRLMPIGFAGGEIPKLPMNLPLLKNYSVVGVFIGAWNDHDPGPANRAVDDVLAEIAAGRLTPKVDRVLPLEDARRAMELVQDRAVQGRVVLEVV